jgi:hypothetical protein
LAPKDELSPKENVILLREELGSSLKLVGKYKNTEIWDLSNKLNCKTPILN